MNRRTSLLLVVVSAGLIACNSAVPGASPSPSPAPSNPPTVSPSPTPPANTAPAGIDGRQFLSVSVKDGDADHPLVPGSQISLDFDAGNLGARAGCNHLFGSYTIDGNVLIVVNMGQTEMGCEPALMAQDQWLIAFLGSRPTIVLSGNDLVLTSGDTVITLLDRELAEPDQPLAGITWTLTSIVSGDTVSSLPVDAAATFLFHEDGTVELFSGCNNGGGTYAVEGDQIRFLDIVMTEMACSGARGQVEQAVIALLSSDAVTWTIDASTLSLMAGQNGLIFSAAMDLPLREL